MALGGDVDGGALDGAVGELDPDPTAERGRGLADPEQQQVAALGRLDQVEPAVEVAQPRDEQRLAVDRMADDVVEGDRRLGQLGRAAPRASSR